METNIYHWVYAIGAMKSDYEVEAIKIGITSGGYGGPTYRLNTLSTGNHLPLELLAIITTETRQEASAIESAAHRNFAHARLRGEWFSPTAVLCQWVSTAMLDCFSMTDLDRNCIQLLENGHPKHVPDEWGVCTCEYVSRSWQAA